MNNRYSAREEFQKDAGAVLLIALMLVVGAWAYPRLPARVPSHWNIRGEIDGWSTPLWGAFGLPLIALGIHAMMVLVPVIDPRRENYNRFSTAYALIRRLLVGFFAVMHMVVLSSGLGIALRVDLIMQAAISVLFILLGNVLGKVKQNWFVGIKTPWTLADEAVWTQTHRVSAWVWTAAGIVGLVATLFPRPYNAYVMFGAIIGSTVFSLIYSFVLFKKRHR